MVIKFKFKEEIKKGEREKKIGDYKGVAVPLQAV